MKRLTVLLTTMALLPAGLNAQFFTDGFNYPNGELTLNDGTGDNVSGGLWAGHSGTTFDDNLTVLNNELIINNSGSEDANRLTGVTMGAGQTWYYGVSFRVNDLRADPNTESINNDYFAHFKDSSLGFRGRAYLDDPNFPDPSKFTIGLAATSGAQTVTWGFDLNFGTTYVMVVSYDYDTGASSLWINPMNIGSTSISEATIINAGTAIDSLAFRQDFVSPGVPNNQVIVGLASIGDDFDQVLAAVMPETVTYLAIGPKPNKPGKLVISWEPDSPGWVLQETLSLLPTIWTNSASGSANPNTVAATGNKKFYRLYKP